MRPRSFASLAALAGCGAVFAMFAVSSGAARADLPPPPSLSAPVAAAVVVRGAATPAYPIAKGLGSAQVFFDAAAGSPEVAVTLLVLKPGASVPPHIHADSVELLYVLEGQAEMRVGAETMTIGPGDAARIPKGVEHAARVVGRRPLRALQLYTPPGPEQRFKPQP